MPTLPGPPRSRGYFRFGGYVFHVSVDPSGDTLVKQTRKIDPNRASAHRYLAPLPAELRDETLIV